MAIEGPKAPLPCAACMARDLLQGMMERHKALLLQEARQLQGFMALLMKKRNAGGGWTKEEKALLRGHLKRLSLYVPALIVFALPGGSLLLPLLAWGLDRRRKSRPPGHGDASP